MKSPRRPWTLVILAAFAALSLSCSSEQRTVTPLGPGADRVGIPALDDPGAASGSARNLYPIHLGNHWSWLRELKTTFHFEQDPPQVFGFISQVDQDQVCEEFQDGRLYTIERVVETSGSDVFFYWLRVRQDRTGLYEAVDTSQPSCYTTPQTTRSGRVIADPLEGRWNTIAAGIPAAQHAAVRSIFDRHEMLSTRIRELAGWARPTPSSAPELLRLKYPLHTRASWTVRTDPLFVQTVEGVDPLETVAGNEVAYRIRVDSELFDPHDRVWIWYGSSGFLQLRTHLEGEGTDGLGHNFTFVSEESYTLTELSLIHDQGPPQP